MRFAQRMLLFAVIWLLAMTPAPGAEPHSGTKDTLEVSLLTCAPGSNVYELYGHTALRVRNTVSGEDMVFNYGIFDFRTPHFAWRFMMGRTDYILGAVPFSHFVLSYMKEGRSVEAQVLNLTPDECTRLSTSLAETFRKVCNEGWTYRYNFLYDNCTTRAIDEITRAVKGQVKWPSAERGKTFRGIINEHAAEASPWYRFGQDLILGAETDAPIGLRGQMFAPLYAARFADSASIITPDGQIRPLVKSKTMVAEFATHAEIRFPLSPMAACCLLLLLTIAVCTGEWHKGKIRHWFDNLLLLLMGSTGCIVALLFFLSEHPAVGSNALILLINPLPLVYIPWKIWRERHHRETYFTQIIAVLLCLFCASRLFIFQKFPAEIYVLALCLLVRVISETLFKKTSQLHYHK